MITASSISTISYIPRDVLESRLTALQKNHIFDFWGYICHKGEIIPKNAFLDDLDDDIVEGADLPFPDRRDKDHIHVFMIPSSRLDTNSLLSPVDGLSCFDIEHPERGLLSSDFFRKSKFSEWYLYNLHYPEYIAQKGEQKEFTYSPGDFVWSDKRAARNLIDDTVCNGDFAKLLRVRSILETGGSCKTLVTKGIIKPGEVFSYSLYCDNYSRNPKNFLNS